MYQPFFIVFDLPFSVVRGETLQVDVLVFNYLDADQDVTVTLLVDSDSYTQDLTGPAGEVTNGTFQIQPESIGELTVTVTAACSEAGDKVEKVLSVRPEGVKQYYDQQVFLDLRIKRTLALTLDLPANPPGWVTGSDHVEVRVVGDVLGPAVNNLDRLIRMPDGCREQAMAHLAPNVAVAKYLKSKWLLTAAQNNKLLPSILGGYQHQLSFR